MEIQLTQPSSWNAAFSCFYHMLLKGLLLLSTGLFDVAELPHLLAETFVCGKNVIVDRRCEAAHIDLGTSDCRKRADLRAAIAQEVIFCPPARAVISVCSSHSLLYLISIFRDHTTGFPVMLLSVIQENHERIYLHLKTCKKIKKTSQTATFINKSARPWLKAYR